jgi:hypothetical protein
MARTAIVFTIRMTRFASQRLALGMSNLRRGARISHTANVENAARNNLAAVEP